MPNVLIPVTAGAGTGAVADLRGLKSNRSFVFSGPSQANVQIELSPDGAPNTFVPIKTLLFAETGSKPFDNATNFARAVRPANTSAGACLLWAAADAIDCCGGGGNDPACQFPVSGTNSTVSNEAVTIGTFAPPGDGTYTISWSVTGRETATNKIVALVAVSTYHVIAGVATKVGVDNVSVDVDEPTGFGMPVSNPSGGNVVFEVTGKLNAPATWVLGGCVQANLGTIPPP